MKITCNYCHNINDEDEHRCTRCGRRLLATASPRASAPYNAEATAPVLRPVAVPSREVQALAENSPAESGPPSSQRRVIYQRSLFNARETPQVVSLDSIVLPPEERHEPRPERTRHRTRRPIPGQQSLQFAEPRRVLDTEVEAVIYCDAPVAIPTHRMLAAAVDLSLIVIALGLFMGVFLGAMQYFGTPIVLTKQTIPFFFGIGVVFGLLYKFMWCIANGDSAGMRWTRQRLVNFDGHPPDRDQRLRRIASGCLSVMAAGLGIVWALVDEESLTWHDHISKTFPTPY